MRNEPKIGTKAPAKVGGTGGGLSKSSVASASKKVAPAAKPSQPRNMRMEVRSRAEALKKT